MNRRFQYWSMDMVAGPGNPLMAILIGEQTAVENYEDDIDALIGNFQPIGDAPAGDAGAAPAGDAGAAGGDTAAPDATETPAGEGH